MPDSVIDLFHQLADNDFGFFQRVTSLAEIMSTDVKTLTLDDSYQHAVDVFSEHRVHHAPVIADDGEVAGIVSDRDLLRFRPPHLGTAAEGDNDHLALRETAARFMSRGTVAVSIDDSPQTAIEAMLTNHIDCVLVYDQHKKLEGILTVRDFMRMVLLFHQVCTRGSDLVRFRLVDLDLKRGLPLDVMFSRGTRSVRDVMTKDPATLSEDDTIETAIATMTSLKVRHLPVVDDSRQLVGMISDREIVQFLPLPVPQRPNGGCEGFRDALFALKDARVTRQKVTCILNKQVRPVTAQSLFTDTVETFMNNTLSGVAVLDESQDLCGILTTTDVLRVFQVTLQIGSILTQDVQRGSSIAAFAN